MKLLCFVFVWLTASAAGAQAVAPGPWDQKDGQIIHRVAQISFPARPAGLRLAESKEFGASGEGMDAALLFRSSDRAVLATAYLYYPGLPHAGLASIATDNSIRSSDTPVSGGESRIVAAGGKAGAAIRRDYSNYKGGMASSAAFAKAGRWIVKLRVSGPGDRRQEVDAAMNALLGGLDTKPLLHPARPIEIEPCPVGQNTADARRLPNATGADVGALGFLGTFDGGGLEAKDEKTGEVVILGSRVPNAFCRPGSSVLGERLVLRASGGPTSVDGRTRLVVILSDAGDMLELVDVPQFKRHVLLHHKIGATTILSSWDGVPSDAQMGAILSGADKDALKVLVPIRLRPSGGSEMVVPTEPKAAAQSVSPPAG
jgi:hypothetical protein